MGERYRTGGRRQRRREARRQATGTPMAAVAAVVVLVGALALAGCGGSSSSPDGGTPSSAQLRARLLPPLLSNGWTAAPEAAGQFAATTTGCARLMTGADLVAQVIDPQHPHGTAWAGLKSPQQAAGSGVGTEALYSFPGDGAAQDLTAVKALAARCPTATEKTPTLTGDYTFTAGPGPKLGDASLLVRNTESVTLSKPAGHTVERSDVLLVRVGRTLLVLTTGIPSTPADNTAVLELATAAVQQLTAAHPEAVASTA